MRRKRFSSGLVPAPAAKSVQGRRNQNKRARRALMTERETVTEDGCQRTRDAAGPGPGHRKKKMYGLAPDPDPDRGKGGKTTRNCNHRPSPPETRSHSQERGRDTGLDRAQERKRKKGHHQRVLRKPAFRPLKTQNSYRARKKTRMSVKAPSKTTKLPQRLN